MNRTIRLASAIAALALAGACSSGTTGSPPSSSTVKIVDSAFQPGEITIKAGDTVRWDWAGDLQHSVTADDGSFDAGVNEKGHTFSHAFAQAGRFEYFCNQHSTKDGTAQNGVVIVQ